MKKNLAAFIVVIVGSMSCYPQTLNEWVGFGDGTSWSDVDNWDPGLPATGDDVIFGQDFDTDVLIDQNIDLRNFNMSVDMETFNIIVGAGFTVDITGTMTINVNTFTTNTGAVVIEDLTVAGGTFTQGAEGLITITDLVSLTSGAINWNQDKAASLVTIGRYDQSGGTFNHTGNAEVRQTGATFTHSGGTFNHANSGVSLWEFRGTVSPTITGTVTFGDLLFHNQATGNLVYTIVNTITVTDDVRFDTDETGAGITVNTGTMIIGDDFDYLPGPTTSSATGGTATMRFVGTSNIDTRATVDNQRNMCNIEVNSPGNLVDVNDPRLNMSGDFTVIAGTVDFNNSSSCVLDGDGTNTFDLQSGATLDFNQSTVDFPSGFSTTNLNGLVEYSFAGAQAISDQDYADLTLSGSGAKSLPAAGSVTASGTLTIDGTATLDMDANNEDFSVAAIDDNNTTDGILNTANKITFTGTSSANVDVAGTGTVSYGDVDFQNTAGIVLGTLGGTLEFGDVTITETLSAGSNDIDVKGSWINNGTFTQGSSKVTMNGGTAQGISGTTTTKFFDLEIDNTNGVTATSDVELEGTLSLTSGLFTTTGSFTLTSDATRTGRIGPVSGTYTGDITIQRLIPAVPDWRMLASPVSGTTMADWNTEILMSCIVGASHTAPHFTSVYSYDESKGTEASEGYSDDDDGQTAGVDLAETLPNGSLIRGYFIWAGTCAPSCSPTTILTDLTGSLVSGTQTIPLSFNADAGTLEDDGWNLIGNPFPSDISWDATEVTGGASDVAYVYDPGIDDFITLDQGNGADRDFIPSMQGIFTHCQAVLGGAGTLIIEEADKVSDANNFLKTGNILPRILVSLSGNGYSDDVSLYVVPGTTENFDPGKDAMNPYSLQWDFANFSIITPDSHELEFNKVSGFDQDYTVPLLINWTWPNTSMSYTISLDALDEVPMSTCILLEDTLTGAFTDLRAGAYTFSMAADTGLTPRFVLHVGASLAKDRVNPTCFGASNGAGIAIGQGVGPWSYIWVNSSGDTVRSTSNINTADTLSNVPEDTYTIYVTSSGGVCMNSVDTLVLVAPADLTANSTVSDISCFGMADGSIDLNVLGGTPPYNYSWSSGQSTEDILAPTGGIYDVGVTDANGCVKTYSITVAEPDKLELSSVVSDVNCNGENNGAVDITAIGGTSPYVYSWSNSESTEDISGLAPGTYSIQVTDNNNCLADGSFEITEPIVVISTFVAQKDTAYLSDGGEVQFTNTSFGASAFEWNFDDGSPANTEVSPLHVFGAAGTYNVTMVASNANNCSDTSYKSTVVMDSPLVGIGNELTDDLSLKVTYITNGDGLFAEFSFEEPTSVNLRIFNILGQEVSRLDDVKVLRNTVKIMGAQKTIATYLIRVDTESGSASKKVIY
ncbi:MAG TPA: PKD domain-containing protein [Flavobacteriales bacterium]|nr:PKD domain-containing protein [Flavobacteriales bacterium]